MRDLGSRNGTFVNGGSIIGERVFHSGDEILLGRLRLLFHGPGGGRETAAIAQVLRPAEAARGARFSQQRLRDFPDAV